MAVQEGLTSIRVSWTPSSDATGYIISYTGGGSSDSVTVSGGSTDERLLTGLMVDTTYTISIAATSQQLPSDAIVVEITLSKKKTLWKKELSRVLLYCVVLCCFVCCILSSSCYIYNTFSLCM